MRAHIAIVAIAAFIGACESNVRQGADPQLTSAKEGIGWPTLGQGASRYIRIDLGPDTFAECQRLAPKFPFDSATTYAQDRMQLSALATCLNAPGMRDRTLQLVGRADARGTDAYNARLGLKRAEEIKRILIENGITESRIEVVTEGEREAVGAAGDDATHSFGYDRRVDVIVRGGTHSP